MSAVMRESRDLLERWPRVEWNPGCRWKVDLGWKHGQLRHNNKEEGNADSPDEGTWVGVPGCRGSSLLWLCFRGR